MSDDDVRPGGFEDRLLGELRMVVAERASDAERPSGRPRGHLAHGGRRFALAGAVAVIVALVGMSGLLLHFGDGAPPAYAVTRNVNGSVTVEVRSLRDAAGLQRALRAAGVPALVRYTPPGKMCRRGWFQPAGKHVAVAVASSVLRTRKFARFTIGRRIPPGDTLVITTQALSRSGSSVSGALGIAIARGPVGACRLVPSSSGGPTGSGGSQMNREDRS
jgi:hypothetical protein